MSVLSWNCRGSGGSTVNTLNRYLRCTHAQFAFISETRCNLDVARQRIRELPLPNYAAVASRGSSGGLWLLWGAGIDLTVLFRSRYLIIADVKDVKLGDWRLIAVYGDPHRTNNTTIWADIETYLQPFNMPTCLLGDFNAIMAQSEKWGGSQILNSTSRSFITWANENGLIDLGFCGPAYTWGNKQSGRDVKDWTGALQIYPVLCVSPTLRFSTYPGSTVIIHRY